MPAPRPIVRTRVVGAGRTDVGRMRRHNEDHVLVRNELSLFAVADGMGGHNAGDVASALATKSVENFFLAIKDGAAPPGNLVEDEPDLPDAARLLVLGVKKANHDVFEISSTFQQHQGMGSTIVAAFAAEQTGLFHVAHVGDSRCYRIRDGEIEQLTKDHSLVNDALAIKPDLTADELARLPRNIITRALGMKDAVKVDVRSFALVPGDVYVLCSDGLSGMVEDEQIVEICSITEDLDEACELLIALANDQGGSDNITAIVARVEGDGEEQDVGEDELEADGVATVREASSPELVIKRESSSPQLDVAPIAPPPVKLDALPKHVARKLERGDEVEIGRSEPPGADDIRLARCRRCDHELYVGDTFCVECGAKTDG